MESSTHNSAWKPNHRIRTSDWPWLFAYPVYQIIGTFRHEAGHVLVAAWQGARITKFVFWPTWGERFYWGYVQWVGRTTWLTSAAPYFLDLVTFTVFLIICTRVKIRRHWIWVNLYAIGLVSPLVNSAYRYGSNYFRTGDLTSVLKAVPPAAVHAYFIVTMFLYVSVLIWIQRSAAPSPTELPQSGGATR